MWVGRVFLGKCEDFSKIWVSTLLHRLRPVVSWFMTEDYPRPIMELERCFPDESSCRAYLSALRWPDGFVCPCCGGRQGISIRRDLLRCTACRHEASATAGTIFQDSKLPLTVRFRAMWQMASQKNGISAMGLRKVLGLGSYESSFQENRANRRPISLKIISAFATMGCFFIISPETVDLAIITCANGTPETFKEIKRRFV